MSSLFQRRVSICCRKPTLIYFFNFASKTIFYKTWSMQGSVDAGNRLEVAPKGSTGEDPSRRSGTNTARERKPYQLPTGCRYLPSSKEDKRRLSTLRQQRVIKRLGVEYACCYDERPAKVSQYTSDKLKTTLQTSTRVKTRMCRANRATMHAKTEEKKPCRCPSTVSLSK